MALAKQFQVWTDEDIAFLIDNYRHMTTDTLAKNLDRTPQSVGSRLTMLRKAGVIVGERVTRTRPNCLEAQMKMNREAVQSEVTFLLGFGEYPDAYRSKVKAGLARYLLKEPPEWFWARKDWALKRWMNFFCAVQS